MRKPVPEDFGITAEEYKWVETHPSPWAHPIQAAIGVISIIAGVVTGFTTQNWGGGFLEQKNTLEGGEES